VLSQHYRCKKKFAKFYFFVKMKLVSTVVHINSTGSTHAQGLSRGILEKEPKRLVFAVFLFRIMLGIYWGLPGAFLGPSWGLPGAFLGPSWGLPGAFLGPSWGLPGGL
jgi:hypothetical protein